MFLEKNIENQEYQSEILFRLGALLNYDRNNQKLQQYLETSGQLENSNARAQLAF